jgi:long-chain acyl-CoA synthetase
VVEVRGSSASGGADVRPDGSGEALGFWAVAEADPARPAVVDHDGATTTFGELRRAARSAAECLADLGLRPGDGLVVVLPNVPSFLVAYLAAMESGLYLTPVNSHLAAPEIAHVVQDCEAGAAVVHAELIDVARPGLEEASVPRAAWFADPEAPGFVPLERLVSGGDGSPLRGGRTAGAVMMYTSGTTGRPKGVRRRLPGEDPDVVFGGSAAVYCQGFGMPIGAHAHLVCGPLYHAGPSASATAAIHAGNTLVLMRRWTPEGFLDRVERHRVASTQMVPTMFHRLLALPEHVRARYDVSSVRSVMHTGAPCPMHVKQRFMDWFGPVVYETYGGTESVATIATPRRWLQKPGTVGRPIRGVTVHILDDDGNECPPGTSGAIYIENQSGVRAEYFKDPEKTASMRRGDLVTLGDVGYLDDDGYLFLNDRRVDMVISGGVNIYPAEIESVLLQSPLIADVAVIGVPDEEWGEQVMAIVEPAADLVGSDELAAALVEHCDGRLARFKIPRQITFVEQLPRLPNGKVEKRTLRAPYWERAERAI